MDRPAPSPAHLPVALGEVVVTTALWGALLEDLDVAEALRALGALLERHRRGDWGELDQEDAAANDAARPGGGRLLSSYAVGRTRVWCITEADRSVTTLLRPEDY